MDFEIYSKPYYVFRIWIYFRVIEGGCMCISYIRYQCKNQNFNCNHKLIRYIAAIYFY